MILSWEEYHKDMCLGPAGHNLYFNLGEQTKCYMYMFTGDIRTDGIVTKG